MARFKSEFLAVLLLKCCFLEVPARKCREIDMTQISSMTGPVSSLRAQLRAQAETALAPEVNNTPFTNRMSNALKEVAEAQNQAAGITKAYELGMENDISKVMVSQQVSSLGFQLTLNVRNKMLSAYKDIMNMPV
jgi:flagellar hook-basal body complex protein FliE